MTTATLLTHGCTLDDEPRHGVKVGRFELRQVERFSNYRGRRLTPTPVPPDQSARVVDRPIGSSQPRARCRPVAETNVRVVSAISGLSRNRKYCS